MDKKTSPWSFLVGLVVIIAFIAITVLGFSRMTRKELVAVLIIVAAMAALVALGNRFRVIENAIPYLFGVPVLFCFWVFIALAPLAVFYWLSNIIVFSRSLPVQLVLLLLWGFILILILRLTANQKKRTRLFERLQGAGRFAPFIYSFNVLMIAVVFFASLTFVLVYQGQITVSVAPGDFGIADRLGLYSRLMDFYFWQFLDAIPLLRVNQTFDWDPPLKYEGRLLGAILLLFKLTVIFPVIGAFVGFWKQQDSRICWEDHMLPRVPEKTTGLRVTFLGVSTLLFDDGETAFLIDGFFTRPNKWRTLFEKLKPDEELIAQYLKRLNVKKLAAVIVVHSHYDHALDAPVVAKLTGAKLTGSEATAAIGRAFKLPESEIDVIKNGAERLLGRFKLKFIPSRHVPISFLKLFHIDRILLGGKIKEPFPHPARSYDYKEGGSYSLLIEHDGRRILVQASPGYVSGALQPHRADVVFLGIGTLGKQTDKYRADYWREVVQAVGARRVIPIHWDNFSISLDDPLKPQSRLVDNVEGSISFLLERGKQSGVDVRIPQAWAQMDPFERLSGM